MKLPEIEDYGKRHRRTATAEHMLIFEKKSVQETEQHQHTLRTQPRSQEKIVHLGRQTAPARKAQNGLSKITENGKGKARLNETIPQKDNMPERQGERMDNPFPFHMCLS